MNTKVSKKTVKVLKTVEVEETEEVVTLEMTMREYTILKWFLTSDYADFDGWAKSNDENKLKEAMYEIYHNMPHLKEKDYVL